MPFLAPEDIEWIQKMYSADTNDDVWRRLWDDFQDQKTHIRLLKNGRDRAEMGVLGMCAREVELQKKYDAALKQIENFKGELEIAWDEDEVGKAERKVLDAMKNANKFSLIELAELPAGEKFASVGPACNAELDRRKLGR